MFKLAFRRQGFVLQAGNAVSVIALKSTSLSADKRLALFSPIGPTPRNMNASGATMLMTHPKARAIAARRLISARRFRG